MWVFSLTPLPLPPSSYVDIYFVLPHVIDSEQSCSEGEGKGRKKEGAGEGQEDSCILK